MKSKKVILCVVGTRPEAIKMAPIILLLSSQPWAKVIVLATAQHRHLLDQVLQLFGIKPDIDLDIMSENQSLSTLAGRILVSMDAVLQSQAPDAVLVQGDTTTVMSVALACFYQRIPVGHVEAGLRTWNMQNPFPEEANRVIAGKLATWHFAPTPTARANLLREGVPDEAISVVGNTVIDALLMTVATNPQLTIDLDPDKRLVLITSHRRENFGVPLRNICRAIRKIAEANQAIQFLFPVHPNPNIKEPVHEFLQDLPNMVLCAPLDYKNFVAAMQRAYLILTDSGGVQEEAPALGKPVLVLREDTERPEAVEQGVVQLIGSDYDTIVEQTQKMLEDETYYRSFARGISPYGDGHAAKRIVQTLGEYFSACD